MPQALAKSLNQFSQGTLWLTILLTPFVALAGGLGFQATGCLLGISAILVWAIDRTEAAYLRAFWPLFLMAFMGWAWISSLWSGYKGDNAYLLAGLLVPLLFVPMAFLRVPPRARHPLILTVIAVSLLGIAMLVIDTASGFAISLLVDPVASGEDPVARRGDAEMNLGRGQISYLQLLWPVAGLLMLKFKRGWILTALCFLGLALSAYFNRVSIVFPTLFISVAVALLAWRNPRLGLGLAFFIAIASIVVSPLLGIVSGAVDQEMMRKIPLSWEHRLRMWAYSWELIKQAPLIGHGFDSAREFNQLTFRAPDGRDITVPICRFFSRYDENNIQNLYGIGSRICCDGSYCDDCDQRRCCDRCLAALVVGIDCLIGEFNQSHPAKDERRLTAVNFLVVLTLQS